jgi:hypothetical protein
MIGAMSYIDATYDEATRRQIYDALPADVRAARKTYKRVEWYPVEHFSAFLREIANLQKNEADASSSVADCGSAVARDAANTFLKLLMRVLTPVLFAKKLEKIWARDHDFGAIKTDISQADEKVIKIRIEDVEGYDFIGPLAVGYFRFAIGSMGKKGLKVHMEGWSLANPGPRDLDYTITWAS